MANEIFDMKNYDKLRRKVNQANKAIARIERVYGEDSWGVNRLYNKLDNELYNGITKGGRIRLNKTMSDIQLKAVEKATNNFLDHKATSTLKGIKNTIKEVKSKLAATLGDINVPLTNRQINKLYDLVEDKDKRTLTEQIGASTLWVETQHARDNDLSFTDFTNNVNTKGKIDIKDKDDLNFLKDLFKDYTGKEVSQEEIENIISSLNIV